MAASERVVVLMTAEQKAEIAARARAENLSLSEYMRRRATDDDELLRELLVTLERSTREAREALDETLERLNRAERGRSARDREAYERALAEFANVDANAFADLATAAERTG